MDRIKKNIPHLLILVFFVSLGVIFRSFLMTNIIEPIALMFWLFWRTLSSVEQNIYWIALIVFCVILVVRLIPYRIDKSPVSAYNYSYNSLPRVEYWHSVLDDAVFGRNETDELRESLQELLAAVIAQIERSDLTAIDEIYLKERVFLSTAAYRYLFPPKRKHGMFSTNFKRNIMQLIPKRLRKRAKMYIQQDITTVDEILQWMEAELEISSELEITELETNYG